MSSDEFVLGVDEHTGLVIDLERESAAVVGNSGITLRKGDREVRRAAGDVLTLAELRSPEFTAGAHPVAPQPRSSEPGALSEPVAGTSLAASTDACRAAFDDAVARGDADAAVTALLTLEAAIRAWSADTLQSDERDRAVAALRSMISRLGEVAVVGLRDPRGVVGPFVDGLLALRAVARAEKRYDLSDLVRDRLLAAGVEVRDTKNGVEWVLKPQP
jgi:hypothetical protein